MPSSRPVVTGLILLSLGAVPALAQFGGGRGGGIFGGRGGFGGGRNQDMQVLDLFDQNADGELNVAERQAAYLSLANTNRGRGRGLSLRPEPGIPLGPEDVATYPADVPLYDAGTLRTLFLEFEDSNWEAMMAAFNNTDIEMPATLTVDGVTYPDVGVHFRGNSSFSSVSDGYKRSLNVSLDWKHEDQDLLGYQTLNLLNSHVDPTFLRYVLYMQVARQYMPAPQANFVRVVINGENWGIYVNGEQFNKHFVGEWEDDNDGARWHITGSPGAGNAGLTYLGDNPDVYRQFYEIKTRDDPEDWQTLIELTRVLNQTPPSRLEAALEPLLDIDESLRFIAVDNALINADGYWTRASDYSLYRDGEGRFHVVPHDANETFREPEGGRGGSASGVRLSPLQAAADPSKPLVSRLLAVPALRERYLDYVREIAETWLDWNRLGPIVDDYRELIGDDVARDTHKLYPTADFDRNLTRTVSPGFGGSVMGLRPFAEERRAYLLQATER